jgi:plasmid stabilization system protein ParE
VTPVRWSRLAREDLNNTVDRKVDADFETAQALLEEAAKATIFLATSPRAGAPLGAQGGRKWRLGKPPYALLYQVDAKRVLILRVAHLRSDWQTLL